MVNEWWFSRGKQFVKVVAKSGVMDDGIVFRRGGGKVRERAEEIDWERVSGCNSRRWSVFLGQPRRAMPTAKSSSNEKQWGKLTFT